MKYVPALGLALTLSWCKHPLLPSRGLRPAV